MKAPRANAEVAGRRSVAKDGPTAVPASSGAPGAFGGLTFFVPVRTVSEANARGHWSTRSKRAAEQREAVSVKAWTVCHSKTVHAALPLVVTLTRVAPRKLDDDNLRGALKACRDAIAKWIGVDDRFESLVRYEYAQEPGKPMGVRVEVRRMGKAA